MEEWFYMYSLDHSPIHSQAALASSSPRPGHQSVEPQRSMQSVTDDGRPICYVLVDADTACCNLLVCGVQRRAT